MSRPTQDSDNLHETYLYGIITLYDHTFQYIPVNCMRVWLSPITPILPQQYRFGLFPFRSPLLGKSIFSFFSCRYLDVSVPCVRSLPSSVPGSLPAGSPIRTSADLGIFAPPRGFSQLVTSFFASESLGIPHTPFSAFLFLFALARSRFLSLVLLLTADASTSLEVASARFLLFAYAYASVCQ